MDELGAENEAVDVSRSLDLVRHRTARSLRTRCYDTPAGPLPSVTTILSRTADKPGLHAWRRRVGAAEAARVTKEAADRGTRLHADVEGVLLRGEMPQDITPWLASLVPFLGRVQAAHLVEGMVWHPLGYAGCLDLLATVDGELAIVDWKTASRPKLAEWTEDYQLQVAAYCAAASSVYGLRVRRGWVAIALEDQEAQVVEVDAVAAWARWKARVAQFRDQCKPAPHKVAQ